MIVISGASGRLGLLVFGKLSEKVPAAGVRLLSRDPSKLSSACGHRCKRIATAYPDAEQLLRRPPQAVERRVNAMLRDLQLI